LSEVWLGLIAALGNIVGGTAVLLANRSPESGRHQEKNLHLLLHMGAGFLLAVTLLEMVPSALKTVHSTYLGAGMILGGYVFLHLIESFVSPHTHGEQMLHEEPQTHPPPPTLAPRTVYGALVGLTIHAAFDGIAIGSGGQLSPTLGWLLTVAIVLHKIPEGATVTSLGLLAGLGRRRALRIPALLAVATVLGTMVASRLHPHALGLALAAAAGVTLYIAASDLVPHARQTSSGWRQSGMLYVGIALFLVTDLTLHLMGLG
jgi:zinc transporter ZupT